MDFNKLFPVDVRQRQSLFTYRVNYEDTTSPTGGHGLYDPWTTVLVVGRHKVLVLERQQIGFWHDIEILQAAQMLHLFNVLVQPILACQFIRSAIRGGD